jgi:hypothetical protein
MNIESSADMVQLMRQILPQRGHSLGTVWLIGVDADHNINVIDRTRCSPEEFNLFKDTLAPNPYDPCRIAFSKGASFMFLVHTHKAGDVKPSKDDFRFTQRQMDEGKVFAVRVVDHIIISGDEYYSMADNGTLGMPENLLHLI